jgi:hypothetical protein
LNDKCFSRLTSYKHVDYGLFFHPGRAG